MTNINSTVQPDALAATAYKFSDLKLQFSREESVQILGISVRTLDRLVAEKQLSARRIGSRVLITREALAQFTKRDHWTGAIQ